jgi:hypothetical protein
VLKISEISFVNITVSRFLALSVNGWMAMAFNPYSLLHPSIRLEFLIRQLKYIIQRSQIKEYTTETPVHYDIYIVHCDLNHKRILFYQK